VAVAALLLWLCTAAVGSYLLLTGIRAANAKSPPEEPVAVAAERPAADGQAAASAQAPAAVSAQAPAAAPAKPARDKDRFDPPSLQRAKSEPLPGLRDLAEFAHPALAVIGFAFWLGYVLSRDRLFAMIGLGILLGAVCAGLSWFAVSNRAARRAAGGAGPAKPGTAPMAFAPRLIALHAAGALLTVLFATLIAARA
jgi:hypothetical protein